MWQIRRGCRNWSHPEVVCLGFSSWSSHLGYITSLLWASVFWDIKSLGKHPPHRRAVRVWGGACKGFSTWPIQSWLSECWWWWFPKRFYGTENIFVKRCSQRNLAWRMYFPSHSNKHRHEDRLCVWQCAKCKRIRREENRISALMLTDSRRPNQTDKKTTTQLPCSDASHDVKCARVLGVTEKERQTLWIQLDW